VGSSGDEGPRRLSDWWYGPRLPGWWWRLRRYTQWVAVVTISALGLWFLVPAVAQRRWTWILIALGFCGAAFMIYVDRLRPVPTTQTHTRAQVHRADGRRALGFLLALAAIFGGIFLAKMQAG
jgi:hypothetical protein